MIELTRCGAPDNDRYLPAMMTQGDGCLAFQGQGRLEKDSG